MTVVEQEHRLVTQLGQRHRRGPGAERMARRRGLDERIASDDLALDVADVGLQRQQRGVERAGLQVAHEVGRLLLPPHHGQLRVSAAHGRVGIRAEARVAAHEPTGQAEGGAAPTCPRRRSTVGGPTAGSGHSSTT
jgi:hypothetical protein